MAIYEIPLTPEAQTFTIDLADVTYIVSLFWCDASSCWIINLADSQGVDIVTGIPLVTGSDLLGQYQYLGIGGSLIAFTDGDSSAVPTYENLGTSSHLYFETA
jgi:hypothetical protein